MTGNKISIDQQGNLQVPNYPIIPFIEGDGIGPDIWATAVKVFDTAVAKAYNHDRKVIWKEVLAGEKAFKATGTWLPEQTLEMFQSHLVGIKGPLTTPVGGGIRSLNVALRQKLDLYACVRPVRYFQGVPSPVKKPEHTSMIIFRENTEDIYAGIEYMNNTENADKLKTFLIEELGVKSIRFPKTASMGVKPVSKEGSERLIEAAIEYALKHKLPSVTLVHKGNIMKFTEGAFKNWGYELAEERYHDQVFTWAQYDRLAAEEGKATADRKQQEAITAGKVILKDVIADAFLQQILTRPQEYSIIATLNLNGDYISDALAAVVGGIGIAPGANINYKTGVAIFEATHGTAPKYAGLDKVNPGSVILSGAMMFDYLGWPEVKAIIHQSLSKTIQNKTVTYDFERLMEGAKLLKCSEFGKAMIENM